MWITSWKFNILYFKGNKYKFNVQYTEIKNVEKKWIIFFNYPPFNIFLISLIKDLILCDVLSSSVILSLECIIVV